MSDHVEMLAANITCPEDNRIAVFTTSTTDVITTLSATGHLGQLATSGHYLTFCADGGDVYMFMKVTGDDAGAAGTVSRTAVAGATRTWLLKDGVPQSFRMTKDTSIAYPAVNIRTRVYHVCTAAAKKLRVYCSSALTSEQVPKP